jgi:hypothetical protein
MKSKALSSEAPSATTPSTLDPLRRVLEGTPLTDLSGIFAAGEVIGRARRPFAKHGEQTRYLISLKLRCGDSTQFIEGWSADEAPPWVPAVGDRVCVPVTVQHFQTKRGGIGSRLMFGAQSRATEF